MEIRKSTLNDLPEIKKIYSVARSFMEAHGNSAQWGTTYPEEAIIVDDIKKGQSYICLDKKRVVAVFCFFIGNDKSYDVIDGKWLNDKEYGVIHRIAVLEGGKGIASFCISWANERCDNIKIDTHKNNIPMQRLLEKLGFKRCGIIRVRDNSERIAYQKEGE